MTDYEKAVASLRNAGLHVEVHPEFEDLVCVEGLLNKLIPLLNPITPELVDHAATELAVSFREKGFLKAEAAEALPASLGLIIARHREGASPTPNPITPEKVEKAIKDEIHALYAQKDWILPTQYDIADDFAKRILTRLKEEPK